MRVIKVEWRQIKSIVAMWQIKKDRKLAFAAREHDKLDFSEEKNRK